MNAHVKMMNNLVNHHLLVLEATADTLDKHFSLGLFRMQPSSFHQCSSYCASNFMALIPINRNNMQMLFGYKAINMEEIIQVCLINVSVLKKHCSPHCPALTPPLNRPEA